MSKKPSVVKPSFVSFTGLSFKKSVEAFEVLSKALKSNKKATVTRGSKGGISFYVNVEVF